MAEGEFADAGEQEAALPVPAGRKRPAPGQVDAVDAIMPTPGEHWEVREDGSHALITDVHLLDDGSVHAVSVRPTPKPGQAAEDISEEKLHLDEFLRAHVHLEDDSEVWGRLDAESKAAMEAQQEAVAKLEAHASRPLALPSAQGTPEERGDASRAIVAAEPALGALSEEMQAKSKTLMSTLGAHAKHREAHANALMVRPERLVGRLKEALFKFQAYVGHEVELVQVRDGRPAESAGPVHMYQGVRFMDEEYLTHLAEGGADIADWPDFINHLCANPETLDRIIPAQVGMCLMQWRRQDKYGRSPDKEIGRDLAAQIGEILENAHRNHANRERWFLYRDGERAWAIFAPSVAHQGLRLWPTAEDLERARSRFSMWLGGRDGKAPTPEDLDYDKSVESMRRFEGQYRAIMLTLAGIQDRESLFRASGSENMWLDAASAPEALEWVADDEALLVDAKQENLKDTVERLTVERIAPGARLFCNWRAMVACQPLVPKKRREALRDKGWRIADEFGRAAVRISRGRPYVNMPMARRAWDGNDGLESQNVKVFLDKLDERGLYWGEHGMPLCSPRVEDLPEIDRHLLSRQSRVDYLRYYDSFERVRWLLKAVRANQADARTVVLASAREEGIDEPAELWGEAAFIWQKGAFDTPMPRSGEDGFDAVCRSLAATVRTLSQARSAPEALAREAAGPDKPAPCALLAAANGQLAVYRQLDAEAREGQLALAPIERRLMRRTSKGWRESGRAFPTAGTVLVPGGERLVWRDPSLPEARWLDATPDMLSVTPEMWEDLSDWLANTAGANLLKGEWSPEEVFDVMADAVRMEERVWRRRQYKQGEAPTVALVVPMGAARGRTPHGSTAVRIGFARVSLISYAYHRLLSEDGLRQHFLDQHWGRVYSKPEEPRELEAQARFHLCSAHALAGRLEKDLLHLLHRDGAYAALEESRLVRDLGDWDGVHFVREGWHGEPLAPGAKGNDLLWTWLTADYGWPSRFPHHSPGPDDEVRERNKRWQAKAEWDRESLLVAPGWQPVEELLVPQERKPARSMSLFEVAKRVKPVSLDP